MKTPVITRTKQNQVKDSLKKELLSGKYVQGAKFYSQNEIADQFKVSHITAQLAVAALVQEGLLTRSQGKGTFVTDIASATSSKNLGLVIHCSEFYNESYCAKIAQGVNLVLEGTEFHSLLITFKEEDSRKKQGKFLLNLAQKKNLDGFLVTDSHVATEELINLQKGKTPFVLVNCYWPETDFDFVCPDFFKASYLATKHLLANGYQPVVYFGGYGAKYPIENERLSGYRKALADGAVEWRADYEILLPFEDWNKVQQKTGELEKVMAGCRPSSRPGIFCGNDLMACEVCKFLNRQGYGIAKDVGIVGGGNLIFSDHMQPPLTTMDYCATELGKVGAEMLLRKIQEKQPGKQLFLEPKIIVRLSSAAWKSRGKRNEALRCSA